MFEDKANLMIELANIGEIAGDYRSPELQPAGQATKLVQGWAFSGYDCGYSTFYYCD
jgi:hypothetical protein